MPRTVSVFLRELRVYFVTAKRDSIHGKLKFEFHKGVSQ